MQSKHLRDLTASNAMTLEQEYKTQQSWKLDNDSKPIRCVRMWLIDL